MILPLAIMLTFLGSARIGRGGVLVDTVFSFIPSWAGDWQNLAEGADGNFYGISSQVPGVFKLTRSGYLSIVARFPWGESSLPPSALLVNGPDGALYGVTPVGGANGSGTVFKMTTAGNITILYSFNSLTDSNGNNLDGIEPIAGLTLGRDGNFYGTTGTGGSNGCGTVFKISPEGAFASLYSFGAVVDTNGAALDGCEPAARLLEVSEGEFYGTTQYGGVGNGTIFKITSSGDLTRVYAGTNGPPSALAQGLDGCFYGTTTYGGSNFAGSIFKMTPLGEYTTIYSLRYAVDGAFPLCGLLRARDGNFYGGTSKGGPGANGTIFRVTANGKFSKVFSFNGHNGSGPAWLLQGNDGRLYGTLAKGWIFRLSLGGTMKLLYQGAGYLPVGGLIQGTDGNLYGKTLDNVFSVNPCGGFRSLGWFNIVDQGIVLSDGVVQGDDGYFYGTTQLGGRYFYGSIFKTSLSGNLVTLFDFNGTNGWFPEGTLVRNSSNDFYGVTFSGGRWSAGTIFRVTRFGELTTVADFDGERSGGPLSLIKGPDGNFYGTTFGGGGGNGTIFELNQFNQLSVLASLDGTNGTRPTGVSFDARGQIISTAASGGAGGNGTFIEVLKPGAISVLASFGGNCGYQPDPPMQASDGNFYGTTFLGGAHGGGSIFQLTPSGKLTALPGDGGSGKLLQGADGALYGVLPEAGDFNWGAVFRLAPSEYRGLFFDTNSVGFEDSGAFQLTVGFSLNVTGTLTIAGQQYAFRGELDSNLVATITVPRPQLTSLTMSLQFSETNNNVFGVIGDGNWSAQLFGVKPGLFNAVNPAPEMGRYAVGFSGSREGVLTVSPYGNIIVSGTLPDHTAFRQNTAVSSSGAWPLFASLYGGEGSLFGWMTFSNSPSSQINGAATWIKTGVNGFTNSVSLVGSFP